MKGLVSSEVLRFGIRVCRLAIVALSVWIVLIKAYISTYKELFPYRKQIAIGVWAAVIFLGVYKASPRIVDIALPEAPAAELTNDNGEILVAKRSLDGRQHFFDPRDEREVTGEELQARGKGFLVEK